MSGRYGYDDRRDYGRSSWDRVDRDWDHGRDWDRGGPRDTRRDWDDRRGSAYDPPLPPPRDVQWDRRDIPPPRGSRDDWPPRDRDVSWSRAPPPPLPVERDVYSDRDRDRERMDRGPADWEGPPLRSQGRKREPEPYDDREWNRDHRFTRGSAEDNDWKRRKVDLDEFEKGNEKSNGYSDEPRWTAENDHPPRKRLEPSEPSQHVIFLGLDPDFNEADLQHYLTSSGAVPDSVTIIRDRATGLSRSFGFAQFPSIAAASAIVIPNFPFVQLPPPASHVNHPTASVPRRCKIDFSQSPQQQNEGGGGGGRIRPEGGKPQPKNDGTRDIGGTPRPVVLLRSLDKTSDIDEIAEAMRHAEGPNRVGAAGMKRILLVKQRTTGTSLGFAFVEMINVESAQALLAGIMNPTLHPTGFRIATGVVAASYALPYAFQLLAPGAIRDDACVTPSQAVGGVEGEGLTRYWDENAVLEEKKYEPIASKIKAEPEDTRTETPPTATREAVPERAAPTELPVSSGPVSLKFKANKAADKAEARSGAVAPAAAPNALGFSVDSMDVDQEAPAEETQSTQATNANEGKGTGKVAPMVGSSKVAKNISKWNQAKEDTSEEAQSAITATASAAVKAAAAQAELKPGDPGFEYGDPVALTCLLCLRQLKSLTQLQRHNNESDMHKNNLKNQDLCKAAVEKVATVRAAFLNGTPKKYIRASEKAVMEAAAAAGSGDTKYRDRAQERRRVHNQPDVPVPQTTKARYAEGPPPPPATVPAATPVEVGKDESNIGNKLLKKMGWSEGSGLGTEGEGRAEPIKTAVYASGAGLGASKGREVTGFTGASYGDVARDAARERYETSS